MFEKAYQDFTLGQIRMNDHGIFCQPEEVGFGVGGLRRRSGGSYLLKIEWGKEIQSPRMTFLVSKGKAMLHSFPKVFLLRNCHVSTIVEELRPRL